MTSKLRLLLLLFLSAIGSAHICSAQEITVLLLDAESGRPLANEKVSVQFHIAQVADLQTLEAKTGSDGQARFHLPEPTPSKFGIRPANPNLYPCSSLLPIDTQQLISEGLVSCCSKSTQGCRCKFSKEVTQLVPTPAKLVLLARPVTWWERLTEHIWE